MRPMPNATNGPAHHTVHQKWPLNSWSRIPVDARSEEDVSHCMLTITAVSLEEIENHIPPFIVRT